MDATFLRGKRLFLRPVLKSDLPYLLKWMNDPETRCFLSSYLPHNDQDEEGWISNLSKRKNSDIHFVMETHEGTVIGIMGIHRIDWRSRTAITGAIIGNPDYRGKEYGTEAKILVLKYCFDELNLRKICSEVLDFNGRSQAYLKKTGHQIEGIRKKQMFKGGKYRDMILLAIFKKDFPKVWKKWKHLVA